MSDEPEPIETFKKAHERYVYKQKGYLDLDALETSLALRDLADRIERGDHE